MAVEDVISALQPLGPPDPYDVESWQQAQPRPSPADLFGQPQPQPGFPPVFNLSPEEMRMEQLLQQQRNLEIVNRMQIGPSGQQPGIPTDVPRKPAIDNRWYDEVQSPGQVTMLPTYGMGAF